MDAPVLTLYLSVLILINCACAIPIKEGPRSFRSFVPRKNAVFSPKRRPINSWSRSGPSHGIAQSRRSRWRVDQESQSRNDLVAGMMQRHNAILEKNRHTLFLRRRVTEIPISTLSAWTIELNESESKVKTADSDEFVYVSECEDEMQHRHFRLPAGTSTVQIRFHSGGGRDDKFYSDKGTMWLILNAKTDVIWFSSDRSIKDIRSHGDIWNDY